MFFSSPADDAMTILFNPGCLNMLATCFNQQYVFLGAA